jgi:hypothetical protein
MQRIRLVRTTAQGEVEMINPQAAQMLLPLTRQPVLQNLFDALENCTPELRDMAARFAAQSGSVCQQHCIHVSRNGPRLLVIACTPSSPTCLRWHCRSLFSKARGLVTRETPSVPVISICKPVQLTVLDLDRE